MRRRLPCGVSIAIENLHDAQNNEAPDENLRQALRTPSTHTPAVLQPIYDPGFVISISRVILTSAATTKPPVSSAAFQLSP